MVTDFLKHIFKPCCIAIIKFYLPLFDDVLDIWIYRNDQLRDCSLTTLTY